MPVLNRVMARLRPVKRRKLPESEDFIVDKDRIRLAQANVFKRDPVNLIRIFYLARRTISHSIPMPCAPSRVRSA